MARLISPQGAVVEVPEAKVPSLLGMGFSEEPKPEKKAPAKKASSSNSEK